jgi:hypothetical protein
VADALDALDALDKIQLERSFGRGAVARHGVLSAF